MKLKANFKGVAHAGVVVQRRWHVVPASLSVHSLSIFFDDNVLADEKTIVLALNEQMVFSSTISHGKPHIFDPPLTIRAGFPTVSVTASRFEPEEIVSGHVVVQVTLGF